MKTAQLIQSLKNSEQDFEFYPTTKKIVEKIYNDLGSIERHKSYSILDVGCGNGNFFTKFSEIRQEVKQYHESIGYDENRWYSEEFRDKIKPVASLDEKFGIEKSQILIQNLPNSVTILGTDFWENTLIDKQVDVIFSNPPYSEFEEWSAKIINEAFCKVIYLVIPERWKNSDLIKAALHARKFEAETLGSFDFLSAERAARAKVDIIKIQKKAIKYREEYYRDEKASDPFDVWFDSEFKINLTEKDWEQEKREEEQSEKKHREEIESELAVGRDLAQVLVGLYQRDMTHLLQNYKKVAELDGKLLKELGVDLGAVKNGLKSKIHGLKKKYWHELFENFDQIKSRLTSSKREVLFAKLHDSVSIDFTESNIYAIVIWVIKNSNQYFDEQLKEIYLELTEQECVKNYKSNQRTWEKDNWRYKRDKLHTHYCLEYRVITHRGSERYQNLFIGDVRAVASNLGFGNIGDVKTFKNGNVHFRFERDFIKALNIEAARLFGWIKSPQEAAEEFPEECKVSEKEAGKFFKGNFVITAAPQQLLLN